ncbi:MAG: SPFH domain-containing protein [Thermonemataceae bacterium]
MWILPIIHRLEIVDISIKRLEIVRNGAEGLLCQDNKRVDVKVVFFIKINKTQEDVKDVVQAVGVNAAEEKVLKSLFEAKFIEALKIAAQRFDALQLVKARDEFKYAVLSIIGRDLNGYHLDDCAFEQLEPTNTLLQEAPSITESTTLEILARQQRLMAEEIQELTKKLNALEHKLSS